MLQQNLAAHQDEHRAAKEFRAGLILCAEDVADLEAQGRERESGAADEEHRWNDVHPQEGEGHAGSQRVDAGDQIRELGAQQITDGGHQRLKAAEVEAYAQHVAKPRLAHGQTLADGHRESIHAQPNSDEEQFNQTHQATSLREKRDLSAF